METKITDNYLKDQFLNNEVQDTNDTPFYFKNLPYCNDIQNGSGSYQSGQIVFDASALGSPGGNTVQAWSEAYIVLPMVATLKMRSVSAVGAWTNSILSNYLVAVKNNSFISSFKVEQQGRTLVSNVSHIAQITNFKLHTMSSTQSIQKNKGSTLYVPDDIGCYRTINDASPFTNSGTYNVGNKPILAGDPYGQLSNYVMIENVNSGLLQRQQILYSNVNNNVFTDATKVKNEATSYQKITTLPTIGAGAEATIYELHYNVIIRLKDYSDLFSQMPITRGATFRVSITLNQGSTLATYNSTASKNIFGITPSTTVFTPYGSATANPLMLCCGPNTLVSSGTNVDAEIVVATVPGLKTANAIGGVGSEVYLTLESKIDTSSDAMPNSLRLYCPTYNSSPEFLSRILSNPIKKKTFLDVYSAQFTNIGAGSNLALQCSGATINPKAIVIMPYLSQSAQAGSQWSGYSPYNPVPATTDPNLSLINLQVKVGSQYVLPDRMTYSWQQFIENTAQIFSLNGNENLELTSGIINQQRWQNNYRYYSFDISRYPDSMKNLPQLISLEGINNSAVPIDLYVYVLYGVDVEFDSNNGTVQIL